LGGLNGRESEEVEGHQLAGMRGWEMSGIGRINGARKMAAGSRGLKLTRSVNSRRGPWRHSLAQVLVNIGA
jgi:hypothetical protein